MNNYDNYVLRFTVFKTRPVKPCHHSGEDQTEIKMQLWERVLLARDLSTSELGRERFCIVVV